MSVGAETPSSEDGSLNRCQTDIEGDELFFYVGLDPQTTWMPTIVWASDSLAKDFNLRVQVGHCRKSRPTDACLVSIGDNPRMRGGKELLIGISSHPTSHITIAAPCTKPEKISA
jgi:hypothetical protein